MELKEGAVIADRFRLERLLGKGGMGDVWAAQHIALDIPCAVKFIHADAADKPEVRERFEREAKAAAALRSPNVVQILDYGIFESVPYLAMEYLEGEPLSSRIRRRGRLDPVETCRVVNGIGRALTRAHAAGIVHRDLKPENVYLVPDEEGEVAKVLDFGVAKRTTQLDSNTRTGALLGTPYYMSPEQAQGVKAVDSRADLWSLAVVAFRCITGELPFKSDALGDLLIRIVTQPPPVPSHVCPGLPEAFDRWWARASQREPEHRYQTAKELCDALALSLGVSGTSTGMSSLGGLPAPSPMQQTMALPEMNTPYPGANLENPQAGFTAVPGMNTPYPGANTPYPGGNTPFPGSNSGVYPPGAAYGQGMAGASGGYPQQPYLANTPQPFGDSGASASVAGVSAAAAGLTPPPARSSSKAGVVIVAVLALGGLAAGAFFLLRPGEPAAPAASGTAASASTSAVSAPPVASASAAPPATPTADPVVDSPPTPSATASASATPASTGTGRVRPPPPDPRRPPTTGSGFNPGF